MWGTILRDVKFLYEVKEEEKAKKKEKKLGEKQELCGFQCERKFNGAI